MSLKEAIAHIIADKTPMVGSAFTSAQSMIAFNTVITALQMQSTVITDQVLGELARGAGFNILDQSGFCKKIHPILEVTQGKSPVVISSVFAPAASGVSRFTRLVSETQLFPAPDEPLSSLPALNRAAKPEGSGQPCSPCIDTQHAHALKADAVEAALIKAGIERGILIEDAAAPRGKTSRITYKVFVLQNGTNTHVVIPCTSPEGTKTPPAVLIVKNDAFTSVKGARNILALYQDPEMSHANLKFLGDVWPAPRFTPKDIDGWAALVVEMVKTPKAMLPTPNLVRLNWASERAGRAVNALFTFLSDRKLKTGRDNETIIDTLKRRGVDGAEIPAEIKPILTKSWISLRQELKKHHAGKITIPGVDAGVHHITSGLAWAAGVKAAEQGAQPHSEIDGLGEPP